MTLLHGTGGFTGKRARGDRTGERTIDLHRRSEPQPGELSLQRGLSVEPRRAAEPPTSGLGPAAAGVIAGDVTNGDLGRSAILAAALGRLAVAGPTPADVLELLVTDAAALLDAPARLAVATADRLVWTASCGDPSTPIGAEVDVSRTACGAAWRTAEIQHVSTPVVGPGTIGLRLGNPDVIELDRVLDAAPEALSTRCSGSPASLLAVPLLRPGRPGPARHADPVREVIAVLALIGVRPGWFDDADIETAADLAEVAGERIAALARAEELRSAPAPVFPTMAEVSFLPPPALAPVPDPAPEPDGLITDREGQEGFDGWFAPVTPLPPSLPTAPVPRLLAALRQRSRPERAQGRNHEPEQESASGSPDQSANQSPDQSPEQSVDLRSIDRLDQDDARPTGRVRRISPAPDTAEPVTEPTVEAARPAGRFASPTSTSPAGLSLLSADLHSAPAVSPPSPPSLLPVGPASSSLLNRTGEGPPGSELSPASRVPRARSRGGRPTGGTPMPPAMPAPDSMGLWQWDAATGTCTWSSPVARLLGLDSGTELTLDLVRAALVAGDRSRFDVAIRAIASGRGVAGALRLKTPDGRAKHAYAWSEVRRDATSGAVTGAWGGVVDVTAFEHDAAALRSGLAGLRAAQELTGLATWEWRPDTAQLIWSDEMYRLVGVSPDDFDPTPERWHAFVHPDDLDRARRLDQESDDQDGERVETFRLIGPGGEIRHVQSWSAISGRAGTGTNSSTEADSRVSVYGATIDVTRQVHDRMMLERLSATDPVTGLGNRLAYDRRMKELLAAAPNAGPAGAVTLMLLDLDRFKVVNDSLGHQIGDRLLIEVARRLVAVVPEGSVTARMGGDEFVVVPPVGAGELEIRRLAIGIVDALRAPYVLPETGEMLICPASLGIASSDGRRVSSHDLLREADIALYRAKDSGRDRFVIFDEVLKTRTKVRSRAERQLRAALESDRLVMEFQPVVDFTNGRTVGAEGLVRLRDTEEGGRLIAPELFLDIAEQTGLVVEVDSWVIEAAIQQLAEWGERSGVNGEAPWLAINLSARSMEHPRIVRRLIDAVRGGELPGGDRLKVELTEHSFIGALPGVEAGLRQLMANGIGVGIDDFGTGYSALAYLHHFDLDFMKIDRSFVASVGEGQRGDAVVTAIVDLAHAHGMRVIAEGVESGRQARRLREMGCDFAQGFHFGRPGEAARIVRG